MTEAQFYIIMGMMWLILYELKPEKKARSIFSWAFMVLGLVYIVKDYVP